MITYNITHQLVYYLSEQATAANDHKAAGSVNTATSTTDTTAVGGITSAAKGDSATQYQIKVSEIPMVEGLTVGADYFELGGGSGSKDQKVESGAYYATYAAGPAVIGYSKNFAAFPVDFVADGVTDTLESIENTKYSIGVNVNDNLSLSYENETSQPQTTDNTTQPEMESTGIQAAYTMGGMTLGVALNDHENASYTDTKDVKDTVFTVEMAF
jgi:hypothetical protein